MEKPSRQFGNHCFRGDQACSLLITELGKLSMKFSNHCVGGNQTHSLEITDLGKSSILFGRTSGVNSEKYFVICRSLFSFLSYIKFTKITFTVFNLLQCANLWSRPEHWCLFQKKLERIIFFPLWSFHICSSLLLSISIRLWWLTDWSSFWCC